MVGLLKKELPEEVKQDLRGLIQKDPLGWWTPYHFTFGMAIRNVLRQHQLGEVDYPRLGNLDDYWVRLVELAVETKNQA